MGERVWRKSSHSGATNGDCVEVAWRTDCDAALRDSKSPRRGQLDMYEGTWLALLDALRR